MKFLFDFDGVLTEQTEEALRVKTLFLSAMRDLTGLSSDEWSRFAARSEGIMAEHPHQYGWKVRDRISAFCDEDLFIKNNALAAFWQESAEADDAVFAPALKKLEGAADFHTVCQHSFNEMIEETRTGKLKPMDSATHALLSRLLGNGHEIVIVSNSSTERIQNLLQSVSLPGVVHEADPRAKLRIRGGAKKFELGDRARGFSIDPYFVDVDRPFYENILLEERPDAVVGDVFSLDLALPFHLSSLGQSNFSQNLNLFLRVRDYTPQWSRDFCRQARFKHARFHLLNDLLAIPTAMGL